MSYEKKFDIDYDYELVLLLSDNNETLIGGSAKVIQKALKNNDFFVKKLDVYFREQRIGAFAVDVCQSAQSAERLQELADKLYANLCDKNTNNSKVAETLNNLDVIYRIDKSCTARLIARTISKWYEKATYTYMNANFGLGLKQAERAELGEQFRIDTTRLIAETLTTLKKKKSPQGAEISDIIHIDSIDIASLLCSYSDYLKSRKKFCVQCKLCGNHFITNSQNTLYCPACKPLRKKNSKAVYREKCSDGVYRKRQMLKYRFENFIHKNKVWDSLSDKAKAEYKKLRDEYVRTSAVMLKEYEENGSAKLEREIENYIDKMNSMRVKLEFDVETIK